MDGFGREPVIPDNGQTNKEELTLEITRQPTKEELQVTEREKRLLEELFDWQEHSNKTHWILGKPLGTQT